MTYALNPNGGTTTNEFQIDPNSGMISSRMQFDRETKDFYILKVYAIDGAPSSRGTSGAHNTGQFKCLGVGVWGGGVVLRCLQNKSFRFQIRNSFKESETALKKVNFCVSLSGLMKTCLSI